MKYFTKNAATVTTPKKPKVIATPDKGTSIKKRTTPRRKLRNTENKTPEIKMNAGKNRRVSVPGQASIETEKISELKDDFNYLKYVLGHKARMFGPGIKLGVPLGQVITHDLSKFKKDEWRPYRDYFYSDEGIKGKNLPEVRKSFREAVKRHKERNKHHNVDPSVPINYRVEAVVDWYSSAKTQSSNPRKFPSFKEWYMDNREKLMSPPSNKVDKNLDFYIKRNIIER